jgi:hypothetical protein
VSEWIKCSERMPADGARVLFYAPHLMPPTRIGECKHSQKNGTLWYDEWDGVWAAVEVLYWQLLSEPP